jgi:hypothetical protein
MNRPRRDIVPQPMVWVPLLVAATPTPLSQSATQTGLIALYDSIIFSLVSTAANSVFMGNVNVLSNGSNGLEIRAGIPIQLSIVNDRQLYEVQAPLVDKFCENPEGVPFTAWDVSQMYLIAPAPTTIAIGLFKAAWI